MKKSLLLLLLAVLPLHAEVKVPSFFSDHAVLQKAEAVPIWGTAAPGEAVEVSLGDAKASATAGSDGKWKALLNLKDSAPGPFTLTVSGPANKVTAEDVLVGQVWLCSGQSNMDLELKVTQNAQEEIAASANPQLRVFKVARNPVAKPQDDCKGSWVLAGPQDSGNFSAVAYYFGKEVQRVLKEPVGLVNSSVGGTPVEAWTSQEALDQDPELKAYCHKLLAANAAFPALQKEFAQKYQAWAAANGRQDTPAPAEGFAAPGAPAEGWTKVTLPGPLTGLPANGAFWVRRSIEIPPGKEERDFALNLGGINGFETVYWNGKKIGDMTPEKPGSTPSDARQYVVRKADLKPSNVLAIRIFVPSGEAALGDKRQPFLCRSQDYSIPLAGEWEAKAEKELPALAAGAEPMPAAPAKAPAPQLLPAYLYNGMIAPLIPMALRGAIWYQGENNAGRAYAYRTAFPTLINDWRKRWSEGDFPFYWCQLANYQARGAQPEESRWAELREAQTLTLALPNTGQAVLIDLGETGDIHPRNKKDAGLRLAAIALAQSYGQQVPFSGPVYDSMKVEGNAVRIHFKNAEGLAARPLPDSYPERTGSPKMIPVTRQSPGGELDGFALAGADKKWHWADAAKIEGENVVLSSAAVPQPVAVRYDWANNPQGNLYNAAGFPAVPFRTDDFPLVTKNAK